MPIILKKPESVFDSIPGLARGVTEARIATRPTSAPLQPLETMRPLDSALRHWWADASDHERAKRLEDTSTPATSDLHVLAIMAADTADEELFRQAYLFLIREATLGERMRPAEMQILGRHMARWLLSGQQRQVLLAESLLLDPRVSAGLGDSGAETVRALLVRITESKPTHLGAPVKRASQAIRDVVRSRTKQAALAAEVLMATLLPDVATTKILQSMLEGESLDLSAPLPVSKRQTFRAWLSEEIMRLHLDATASIHPTWFATDPALTARSPQIQHSLTPSGAVAAALHWPTPYIPQLLSRFQHHPDSIFLPILATAAQSHTDVIPSHLFRRLLDSSDGRYRAVASLTLGSVAERADLEPPSFR